MEEKSFAGNIGALISILVVIIIGVLIYYSITDTGELAQGSQTFTASDSLSTITHTLTYRPASISEINLTYYNGTTIKGYATVANLSLAGSSLTVNCTNWNQTSHVVTYYSSTGVVVRDNVNPQASTIFTLAPIVAIIVIASLILAVVMGFGSGRNNI